ncbi:phenylalanine--tRNA ligase subunit beta [Pseudomonas abyssi]|uniref:Phenylalanine--tRNA ligase beta subunit n=1 Tax=Pseudomonas abyssi TaxID=170540 RepID=A0A2A3MFU7_9PSED|nr:phenylalanine--tRNA ligase subunit beta [Pseudomonas abyssi]MAD00833.1 phenylalanine--tRNA ligase subunit beta [Pseudomonadales bacterium]PBK03689.1 phenylalanine--tRNA ligase subunit beta [Pseudomonas abyssi]|tara:strand:+ start:15969 stop:18347 length:2379 start_codon:yes stop_codon:yes gene_type:complete
MKFSEQWLRTWVNPDVSRDDLVARLSMTGLEVDSVTPAAGEFSGVVVGEILSAEQHPDADKLRVCRVSNGSEEFQVVCGAPNARAGIKIPFAMVGAVLGEDFKIKKAKLRGVESFGMLCSAAELKVSEDHDGLYELPQDAPVGQNVREYLGLDDAIIEVDLTPNRGDCLSIAGLAREVGANYGAEVCRVKVEPVAAVHEEVRPVELFASEACPRYLGRVIRNVDLSRATPLWMVERLRRSDIRSIDAVVDITNYVMLELGQPMHAFDLAEIKGGIRVRLAEEGEPLVLLDGQEISLRADTLVIADHERPLAMAGIMGGEHSGVSENTRDLFLESAFFDTIAIAGKARGYSLHTDSSHRFERGVDWQLQREAIERATALILEIVGGEPGPVIEAVEQGALPSLKQITLRNDRITQMLGMQMGEADVVGYLSGLGLGVTAIGNGQWQIDVPSHRFDISIEVDLIEELARLYGYNRLPVSAPTAALSLAGKPEARGELTVLRRLLVARGYHEAITYSFIEPGLSKQFEPEIEPLALANSISSDMAVMRPSLWPGLSKAAQYNQNRQQSRVRLFETGQRFIPGAHGLLQEVMLSGIVTGSRQPEGWANGAEKVDFFDVKADVEAILAQSAAGVAFRFAPVDHPALHPGQSACILNGEEQVGLIGALHPQLVADLDLNGPVFVFELALAKICQGQLPRFVELSRYPEVRRDIALVVDRDVLAEDLLSCIRAEAGAHLKNLRLFDVYEGKGIDPHRKSMAIGLTLQDSSRTLTDDEVNAVMDRVLQSLEQGFNATLRK